MTTPSLRFLRSVDLPAPDGTAAGETAGPATGGATASGAGETALAEFHELLAGLARVVCSVEFGVVELATTAEVRRAQWAADSVRRHEAALVYARPPGAGSERLVAAWTLSFPLLDNLETADIEVLIPPAEDSDELFAAVLHDARARAGAHGRSLHYVFGAQPVVGAQGLDLALVRGSAPGPGDAGAEVMESGGAGPGDAGSRTRASVLPSPCYSILEAETEAEAEAGGAGRAGAVPDGHDTVGRGAEAADGASALITVRSGVGTVPADEAVVRRMRAEGFDPVQLERFSLLELAAVGGGLPPDPRGFTFVQWSDATPEAWAEQMADLHTVFEATVPAGGAAFEPEVWDVDRLRRAEATARAAGVTRIVTALAVDASDPPDESSAAGGLAHSAPAAPDPPAAYPTVSDGQRLAGFTLFEHTEGVPLAFQDITVVRPEHRGRGLAVALKRANAAQLRSMRPRVPMVCTWNAVENHSMLAVNNRAGFVPQAFTVVWEADGRSRDAEPS